MMYGSLSVALTYKPGTATPEPCVMDGTVPGFCVTRMEVGKSARGLPVYAVTVPRIRLAAARAAS